MKPQTAAKKADADTRQQVGLLDLTRVAAASLAKNNANTNV